MADDDYIDLAIAAGKVALVLVVVGGITLAFLLVVDPPTERGGEPPTVDLTVERVNATHVRVVHAGGDPLPANHLLVTVDGRARPLGRTAALTDGEAIVVPAPEGTLVEVYWAGDEVTPKLLERRRL